MNKRFIDSQKIVNKVLMEICYEIIVELENEGVQNEKITQFRQQYEKVRKENVK